MDLHSQEKLQELWLAKDYDGFARVLTRRIELHTKNALVHKLLVDRPTEDEDFAVPEGGYYQQSPTQFKLSPGLSTVRPLSMFMRPALPLNEPLSIPRLLQIMQCFRIALDRSFYMMIMHHTFKTTVGSEAEALALLDTAFTQQGTTLRTLVYGPQFSEGEKAEAGPNEQRVNRIALDWSDPTFQTFEPGEFLGVAAQPRAALGAISRTEVVNEMIDIPGADGLKACEVKALTPLNSDVPVPHLALAFTMKYRFCIHNMVHFVPGRVQHPNPVDAQS